MKVQEAVKIRIQTLCRENKITYNHLANLCGMPPSTLKNIMNGSSSNTGIVTISKICNGLEISVSEFFHHELFQNLEQEID